MRGSRESMIELSNAQKRSGQDLPVCLFASQPVSKSNFVNNNNSSKQQVVNRFKMHDRASSEWFPLDNKLFTQWQKKI